MDTSHGLGPYFVVYLKVIFWVYNFMFGKCCNRCVRCTLLRYERSCKAEDMLFCVNDR